MFCFIIDPGERLHTFDQPHIPAYYAMMAYHRIPAKNGGARVNHHMFLYRRMPLAARHALFNAQRTQSYALV